MNTDWQRVKQVMADAAERSTPAERAAFLDVACGGDAALRTEVEKLLEAHAQAGSFLEEPAVPGPQDRSSPYRPPAEKAGERIGPYRLLQQIGEGGCGVVYMAEQEVPIRRRVAIKVIKLGMDTKAVIARFEAERQALALMDHPNIARIFEAGVTEPDVAPSGPPVSRPAQGRVTDRRGEGTTLSAGRPYFVMELVRGIKITDYCDEHHLSTTGRLKLFSEVCHAIQHAHQKGIIHRDIKPSNILVTFNDGVPVPKVIDFGIAKAMDQQLTDKTVFTAFEQFIGTPAYMSPEQAAMTSLDIDTRSDIYALGVLLYELLTGQTPFDPKDLLAAGLDQMRRMIREREPQRPSTRLRTLSAADQTTVAACRQLQPLQLIHSVRGDLDWIVMRCLEKDRTRRYGTANSLAEDIARHLDNEPVMARPPSRSYRFGRLVRRNQLLFAAAGGVAAALALGLGLSLWALSRERTARHRALAAEQAAQTEAAKSGQVALFLKGMLQGLGPSMALGRDTTMLGEILDRTAVRLDRDLSGQPGVEAELRTTLGQVYEALGQYDQAIEMYRQSLRLERGVWGEMHTNVADALDRLGHALRSLEGEAKESAELLEQALKIRVQLLGDEHIQVAASLHHLGGVDFYLGRLSHAADLFQRSLAMRRRLVGNDHPDIAESLTMLADTIRYLHRPAEAEAYAREALALLARVTPQADLPLRTAAAQEALAGALNDQGRVEEAIPLMRQVATERQHLLGTNHMESASALFNLGNALASRNELEAAETTIREAREICRRTLGDRHTLPAFCLEVLGTIYRRTERFSEAETAYREALALWKPRENHHVRRVRTLVTTLLCSQRKLADAELFLAEATVEDRRSVADARKRPASQATVDALLRLVDVLWRQGQVVEMEALMSEALATAKRLPSSPRLAEEISFQAMRNAAIEVWLGRGAEHASLCRRLVSWAADQPESPPKGRAAGMVNLARVNDPRLQADALALARQAVDAVPTNDASIVWYRLGLGVAEYRLGRFSEAERILLTSEQDGPGSWHSPARTCTSQFFRALMLLRQGQEARARRLFAEAEAKMPPLPESVQWALAEGADCDELMVWLAYKEARAAVNPPANRPQSDPAGP